ncbi:hypothetical protein Tco_1073891 [Tanacetum coccineum]
MSSDNASSAVTYTSISPDSDGPSWGIPLMNAGELPEIESEQIFVPSARGSNLSLGISLRIIPPTSSFTMFSGFCPFPSAEETEPFETDESAATPPPPPSYHTTPRILLSSPLSQIQSPPTHHPLPLPAPSTSRKADILEVELPPRKRLLLSAPTPRFEIGESSTAAAARPLRSTVARRVDYGFVDTLDASIRASERESEEFQTRHQDAQDDRVVLRDEVDTLRSFKDSGVSPRDEDDRATRHIMRIQTLEAGARVDTLEDTGIFCSPSSYLVWHAKYYGLSPASMAVGFYVSSAVTNYYKMALKRTTRSTPATTTITTTPMTDAHLKALIDQGVADALAARDADRSRNGKDSHDSGMGVRRQAPLAHECTYQDFMKCKSLYFKGAEGVI